MIKRIIIKSFVFLAVLFALDRIIGFANERLFYKQNHGDNGNTIEVLQKTKAAVLIFGSSRASHHFVSDTLEQMLGISVFNAGRDNMGIHYVNALLTPLLDRYQPKAIVLDIMPNNYCKGGQDNKKYFDIQSSALLPFIHQYPSIGKVVKDFAPNEFLLSKISASYAFNSMIGTSFQNAYTQIGHVQIKGYEPLHGSIEADKYLKPISEGYPTTNELDEKSWKYLEQTIELCQQKNVQVMITFSPYYFPTPTKALVQARFDALCKKYTVPILDLSQDKAFLQNPDYFYDELHLNHVGAVEMSRRVAILFNRGSY